MFVLDVQTKYKGDREYWSNIYNNCFNNDVGNALYSYCLLYTSDAADE